MSVANTRLSQEVTRASEKGEHFSRDWARLFSTESFDLKRPMVFDTVYLQFQPLSPLLCNQTLVNLHKLLDIVERKLWVQVNETVAVLQYPLLFISRLQRGICYLASTTAELKSLCWILKTRAVKRSIKILLLHYRLRNYTRLAVYGRLFQFCKTSDTQYSLALQDSKFSLVCRIVAESRSFMCHKGAQNIYAFQQYLKVLEKIEVYTKNMMYRAFAQFVIDVDASKHNPKYLVATLLKCYGIDNICRAIKYQFRQKLIDVWHTILEAYTYVQSDKHKKMTSDYEHFDLKVFHIPDQLKCMNDATFIPFLDTFVQYLLEISMEVNSTLKEIRIVIDDMSTKEKKTSAIWIRLKEKEHVAISLDGVSDFLLGLIVGIVNKVICSRKRHNASLDLPDMKKIWDIIHKFSTNKALKNVPDTAILNQTMKSHLKTLLEGFHDRNTTWILQSLEDEEWTLVSAQKTIVDFLGIIGMERNEKNINSASGKTTYITTKSLSVLLSIASIHVHFLNLFEIIGAEIIGRLAVIFNIYENRCRQVLQACASNEHINRSMALSKVMCTILRNSCFVVTFLGSFWSSVYTDKFDNSIHQNFLIWNRIISQYIDLREISLKHLSDIVIHKIFTSWSSHDQNEAVTPSNFPSANYVTGKVQYEYAVANKILQKTEVELLFSLIFGKYA